MLPASNLYIQIGDLVPAASFDHRGLALAISAVPGLPARLLAEHVPDADGRCQRCPIGGQAGRQQWPCRIHDYAAAAARLARRP
jgi:hypothetical protein